MLYRNKKPVVIIDSNGERFTAKQLAKRMISICATKNSNDLKKLLEEFTPEEQELIYREFQDITKLMLTRRGFINFK